MGHIGRLAVILVPLLVIATPPTLAGPQGDPYGETKVTGIHNVTATSATVHWDGYCGSDPYAGHLLAAPHDGGNFTGSVSATHGNRPFWANVTGMQPGRDYDVYIEGSCGMAYHAGTGCFRTDQDHPACLASTASGQTTTPATLHDDSCVALSCRTTTPTYREPCEDWDPPCGRTTSTEAGASGAVAVAIVALLAAARRRIAP